MTTTAAFRACRPFSLLLQTSAAFINVSDLTFEGNIDANIIFDPGTVEHHPAQ
jgi:hypothetical protein